MDRPYSPNACRRLLAILENETVPNSANLFRIELATTVDAGEPFVRKTYLLEGDGMMSVDAYTHPQEIATAAKEAVYPNVEAVLKVPAPNDAARQNELRDHAKGCVRPATQHFLRKFNPHQFTTVCECCCLRGCPLMLPSVCGQYKPRSPVSGWPPRVPRLDDDDVVQHLQLELGAYKVAASDVQPGQDRMAW